jgi:signal transduction histidine kinase
MSLERKLPLLIIAVLVVTLAAAIGIAYREVRHAGEVAAVARIETLSRQLVSSAANSVGNRAKLLADVAASSSIRNAVSNPTAWIAAQQRAESARTRNAGTAAEHAKPDAVTAALQRLALRGDSTLAIELWSADGQLLDSLGAVPQEPTTGSDRPNAVAIPGHRVQRTLIPRGDSAEFHQLFEGSDHRVYYWMTVPVIENGRHIGWIAEQARLSSRPGADARINSLLGEGTAAYFRNGNDRFWSTLGGVPATSPSGAPDLSSSSAATASTSATYTRDRHGTVLATSLEIPGTPWWIVLEVDHSTVLAGAWSLLFKFAMFTLPLLIAAAAVSWWLIRRALRPLVDLTAAATLVAQGDYSARVAVGSDDEVGRLGMSFNRMANEVDSAHAKLAGQVHEAQRLANERDQAREAAVSASRAKSNFLATMSHEIRTPINAIIGYADILDLGIPGPLTPKQHENVQRIRTSSSHLLALVNDVLDLSRIESGTMQMSSTLIDTQQSINAAVSLVESVAAAKHIRITVQMDDPRALTCAGDERGVRQVLVNLLSNSIKFSSPDSEITISTIFAMPTSASDVLDATASYVAIRVSDTGIGIEEDKIARLFQPFTQLEADDGNPYTRQTSGAGLGLSISRHLARMMDGDITVESVPKRGSTFTLWLPHTGAGAATVAATAAP